MDITIQPNRLGGNLTAIPSKSQAHRLLICAAFADGPTTLICPDTNEDIEATKDCLNALGAQILRTSDGYAVTPVTNLCNAPVLNCRESGSTLRFLLPIAGALGVDATFLMAGRLPQRPLSPLWEELERMGCALTRPTETSLQCKGKLRPGTYTIDGGVSSQFITGLLFALSLLDEKSDLKITGNIESAPYIEMTREAMALFGADPDHPGTHPFHSPGQITVEGDWSNAAFFLAANTIGSSVKVENLRDTSAQGDKAVAALLPLLQAGCPTICAKDIPDLVPILAVVAGAHHGAHFTDIRRLRLKETDRVATVCAMINALGAKAEATENTLTVTPGTYIGCTVDAANDHRIAMAAAIAATIAKGDVTILGAEAVNKSYPKFWDEYSRLGGTL